MWLGLECMDCGMRGLPGVHQEAILLLAVMCLLHSSSILCALAEIAIDLTSNSSRPGLIAGMLSIRFSTASLFSARV